ncbi:MAG: SoxR reducing system RseC family protein [Granulosicoccus sp.]
MRRSGRVVALAESPVQIPGSTIHKHGRAATERDAGHLAWVQIESLGSCRQCARGAGCGVSVLSSSAPGVQLLCASPVPVAEFDEVMVNIDEPAASWLPLVACAYGLPLTGLLLGTLFGTYLAGAFSDSWSMMQETFSLSGAAVGLFGGLFAWRKASTPLGLWAKTGLCLDTARIVAVGPESMESEA